MILVSVIDLSYVLERSTVVDPRLPFMCFQLLFGDEVVLCWLSAFV